VLPVGGLLSWDKIGLITAFFDVANWAWIEFPAGFLASWLSELLEGAAVCPTCITCLEDAIANRKWCIMFHIIFWRSASLCSFVWTALPTERSQATRRQELRCFGVVSWIIRTCCLVCDTYYCGMTHVPPGLSFSWMLAPSSFYVRVGCGWCYSVQDGVYKDQWEVFF